MKKKERDELKLKTVGELENLVKGLEDSLFKMRLDKAQNKLKNMRSIFMDRKKIAFALTLAAEKREEERIAREKSLKKVSKK